VNSDDPLLDRHAIEKHLLNGVPLEALVAHDFEWREGWEYQV
jgi:hypothetical protein